MQEKYNRELEKLNQYNEINVLNFIEKLDELKKEEILEQVSKIDFELLENLYNKVGKEEVKKEAKIEPIDFIDAAKLLESERVELENIGIDQIKQGKFAVITMAGGQGTRLGHNGPKGTYEFDTENHKSIFEVLCENFKRAYEEYGVYVQWYLMTSVENNKDTVEFFENNNYFGYPKDKITFFIQGQMPMIDNDGKLIIDEKGQIKMASDGHGGIFKIVQENGIMEDMKSKGIEWIYMGGVDNVLSKLIDPLFVGVAIKENVLAAGKSVIKAYPEEKIGVFCTKNGKPSVVEYIELSKDMSEETNENGELKYGEGHILCNLFNIKAIDMTKEEKLPYHIQYKKCNYIDEKGNTIIATEPNAYKFESFLFDVFEKLDRMAILRVKREEEFAPIKNAEGLDSPATAIKLYKDYWNK